MTERFALYYAPSEDSLLWERAQIWLGAASGRTDGPALPVTERLPLVRSARRYGFHATIKAPMPLRAGQSRESLTEAVERFTARLKPVEIGLLVIKELKGFLALVPEVQGEALTAFAQTVVEAFEGFRAPMTAEDRARRLQSGLSTRQTELLDQFGYPYVAEQFGFHMTLTDRLSEEDIATVKAAADDWFAPALKSPFLLDQLVVFREASPGEPFTREASFLLRG